MLQNEAQDERDALKRETLDVKEIKGRRNLIRRENAEISSSRRGEAVVKQRRLRQRKGRERKVTS